MSKRTSRGVTSGIGRPMKISGRDGDLTIRKTHDGKILYVKEHGAWHQLTTGIDVAQLKKDVDRLINSVNTLINENNPFPNKRRLTLSSSDGTATLIKNDSGVLKVRNADDSADALLKAKRLQVDVATAGTTNAVLGEIQYNTTGTSFIAHARGLVVSSVSIGSSGDNCTIMAQSYASDARFVCQDAGSTKWVFGYDQAVSNGGTAGLFKINNGSTLDDSSTFALDTSGNVTLEGGLTSSGVQTITSTTADQLKVLYDINNYALMNVSSSGDLEIETVGAGTTDSDITLNADGDIELNADGGDITFQDDAVKLALMSEGRFDTYYNNLTYTRIATASGGVCTFTTTSATPTNADFILDAGGDITLDSGTGVFISKNAGTEFSAANSAYAGMILGYTDIGLNETRQEVPLTTGYVVPTDEFSVSFAAPPSGNVEIMIQISFDAGSTGAGDLFAGLSSANATSGYAQLQDYYEEELVDQSGRSGFETVVNYFTLTGLSGAQEIWVGFKSSSTGGTPKIVYGGSSTGHYSDFIMKATALPATITT